MKEPLKPGKNEDGKNIEEKLVALLLFLILYVHKIKKGESIRDLIQKSL